MPISSRSTAAAATSGTSSSPKCRRSPISIGRCTAACPPEPTWDAFNWLTNQIGELTYIAVAPPRTPAAPLAALRKGFEGVARDAAFEQDMLARQGIPYSHIGAEQGRAIFRALADVSPDVIATLRAATKPPN